MSGGGGLCVANFEGGGWTRATGRRRSVGDLLSAQAVPDGKNTAALRVWVERLQPLALAVTTAQLCLCSSQAVPTAQLCLCSSDRKR